MKSDKPGNLSSRFIPLLSEEAAARFLGVTKRTLKQWRQDGRGPRFVKVGRSVRYRMTDLEAFVESHTFTNTTEARNSSGWT